MKLVSIPANPVPDDVVTGSIEDARRGHLALCALGAAARPQRHRGLLQGRAEFIEKYFETVRDLRARGFAVATFDWRGQGLSERALSDRRKGHVRNFSEYATDLEAIMDQVVLPDCPPPIFALGHSMGGAIGIRACHDGSRWFDRMVLSAPMIALAGRRKAHGRGRAAGAFHAASSAAAPAMCRPATARRSAPRISSATCSPPIRCATRATWPCWKKRPSSVSARRRSPGPTPRCG